MDIKTSFHNNVIHLELARPHVANALDESLLVSLVNVLKTHHKSQVRALVLTGQGKHFCAGADIQWMKRAKDFSREENIEDAKLLADCLAMLHAFHAPVISVIHGACYGGGLGLAACSDIVIADTAASFSFSEVKLGLIPATISPYVVDAIGSKAAKRLFLTAEKFSADEALRLGLVDHVCDARDIENKKNSILTDILNNAPKAMASAKELVHQLTTSRAETSAKIAETLADIRASKEAQQGLQAFLDKKPAPWIKT